MKTHYLISLLVFVFAFGSVAADSKQDDKKATQKKVALKEKAKKTSTAQPVSVARQQQPCHVNVAQAPTCQGCRCAEVDCAVEMALMKQRAEYEKRIKRAVRKYKKDKRPSRGIGWRYDLETEKSCEGLNRLVTHVPYTLLYFHKGGDNQETLLERFRNAYANFEMHFESVDLNKADATLVKCLDLAGMPPLPAFAMFHENIMAKTMRGDSPEDNLRYQINEQLAKDPRNYVYFNNRAFDLSRWYHRNEELMGMLPVQHQDDIAAAVLEESYLYGTPIGGGSQGDPLYEKYYGKPAGSQEVLEGVPRRDIVPEQGLMPAGMGRGATPNAPGVVNGIGAGLPSGIGLPGGMGIPRGAEGMSGYSEMGGSCCGCPMNCCQ